MIPPSPQDRDAADGISPEENQELMGLLTPRLIDLMTKVEPDLGRQLLEYRQGFADPFDDEGQTPAAPPPDMALHGVTQPNTGIPAIPAQPAIGQPPVAGGLPGGPVPPPPVGIPAPTGLNRFNFKR